RLPGDPDDGARTQPDVPVVGLELDEVAPGRSPLSGPVRRPFVHRSYLGWRFRRSDWRRRAAAFDHEAQVEHPPDRQREHEERGPEPARRAPAEERQAEPPAQPPGTPQT